MVNQFQSLSVVFPRRKREIKLTYSLIWKFRTKKKFSKELNNFSTWEPAGQTAAPITLKQRRCCRYVTYCNRLLCRTVVSTAFRIECVGAKQLENEDFCATFFSISLDIDNFCLNWGQRLPFFKRLFVNRCVFVVSCSVLVLSSWKTMFGFWWDFH